PEEARQYLMKLRQILRYIGVSEANMEEGSFRCDANISLRPTGGTELGAKVEVKNMNSFRAVFRALSFEVERQREELEAGQTPVQETRGWVEDTGSTVSQRTKEYAHDYRYFPEPDLPPLRLEREYVESIRARLPELPDAKEQRFMADYGLGEYEAHLLTETRARADFFDACLSPLSGAEPESLNQRAKAVCNWMLGDFARLLNQAGIDVEQAKVQPRPLYDMISLIEQGAISGKSAKAVFEVMFKTGKPPAEVVRELGLTQISGEEEIAAVVDKVLAANPRAVEDYRGGKAEAAKFLVGQVMKETRGRANPGIVNELLQKKLT
ncbi:MAG TPA: Asp-tRNA(Asn)/Glu-tRNA(Gln) amidotransferase subunit GatB, partial [Dehalococcoidia bacterium]|nr:Asp-tRNA(Asn)/Glu-tRNA(Gln) amidotransferase subunit GatB [Dehalococcoidia bacterium]